MAGGLTNADFALLFRREAKAEDETSARPADSPSGGEDAVNPMMQAAMRRNFADEETWDEASEAAPRAGLGSTPPSEASGSGDVDMQGDGPSEKAKVLSEAELKRKFAWQKHTTGFGLKMMAKMGFTGRLGKDEKGVSATLEVVQRPNQMGLGFGTFKEAGSLKQNKRIEKELRGDTVDENEDDESQRREREALVEDDSLWRKRKVPTGGRNYKKAAEVSHEAHAKKPRNEIILDMRGPDVRVLNQLTDAYVSHDKLDAARPKLGEELIYNVRMVVNLAQGRIYDLTQKIDTNTATLDSMHKEAKILKSQVESDSLRWSKVEEMMLKMAQLESIAANANESLSVDKILDAMRELRVCYPREFEAYKIVQTTPSLVNSTLKSLVLSSNMLDHTAFQFVLTQFQQLQLFLLESPEGDDIDDSRDGLGVLHHIREKSSSLGDEVYNYILEETLWPGVVQMVNVSWDIKHNPNTCAEWFRAFRPHLSEEFETGFLHQLVLPKLKSHCQRWRPEANSAMMHECLQPWEPYLESSLESIYPDVQLALGNALAQWHPSDLSVLPVIIPWREIWGEAEYGKFTHRFILRKLIRCLHREFQVDPHNQSLDALRWVLAWQRHIPERQFVALFDGEFFPKWLKVLRKWVVDKPDLAELETWYMGWKKFFGKHQLATEARLVIHFQGALMLMEAALLRELDVKHPVPELNRFAPSSYQEALVKATASEPAEEQEAPPSRRDEHQHKASHNVNLKDLVEHLAISNDLMFMPKGRHDGQQVYIFGKHHILIEQGVVFVEKAKGRFEPVDIEDLVRS